MDRERLLLARAVVLPSVIGRRAYDWKGKRTSLSVAVCHSYTLLTDRSRVDGLVSHREKKTPGTQNG